MLHEDVLQQNTAISHSLQSQRERHKAIERGHSILFKSCCKEVKLTWGGCYIREECAHSFLMQVRALSVQGREQMGRWWRAHASWMALCILLLLCHAGNSPAVSSAWIKHNSAQLTSFMQLQTFFKVKYFKGVLQPKIKKVINSVTQPHVILVRVSFFCRTP